ncbi:MAG TPA: Clp protease N-terminal domain-containing protein [Pirellulales bacterium]|nr:Clp protease N-terminal domain-containing protein [Pirellulales bacterium]
MANPYSLQQFWSGPEVWRRERWWVVAWLVWGTICAVGVGLGDRSLPTGSLWLLASALIAAFGQGIWGLFSTGVFKLTPIRWRSLEQPDDLPDLGSDRASLLFWLGNEQLSFLDPNRKWWELYPSIVLAVAPIHGAWAGSLVGLAAFYISDWPKSALQGALVGSIGGIFVLILIYGIAAAAAIARTSGPRIDGLRPIVRRACVEAGERGHEFLLPGHLLVALIETPAGAVAKLLAGTERNIAEARRYILDETDAQAPLDRWAPGADDEEPGQENELLDAWEVLSLAIGEARSLHHADVRAGHVLLALLTSKADLTTRALTILGTPTDDLRQRIVNCM